MSTSPRPSLFDVQEALCRALGFDLDKFKGVTKLVLTIEAGKSPVVMVERDLLVDGQGVVVADRLQTVCEMYRLEPVERDLPAPQQGA
jgi:hypothetical protein